MRWWCGWSRTPGPPSGGTPSAAFGSASRAAFPSVGSACRSRRPSHRGRTTPPPPGPCRKGDESASIAARGGSRYPGIVTGRLSFDSVQDLQAGLRGESYLADRGLATAIYLAVSLDRPLLLEGEAGVGKTEVAKALASLLSRELIRLQCYEGIDASQALYEWNYSRQLIAVRTMQDVTAETHVEDLFGPEYLVERPLLAAIRSGSKAVLLVDELDRADDEFEAFLVEIVRTRAPGVSEAMARDVAGAVARLRSLDVAKRPGVAETIDWANALSFLGVERLDEGTARETLGA